MTESQILNKTLKGMATAAECANPLLAQFLKEWWDIAKERNSKGATTLV